MNDANKNDDGQAADASAGGLKGLWNWFWRPAPATALGTILIGGFVAGIVFWGGFNWAMELTNTEKFCISCHEMKDNVYKEYRTTIHFTNRTGVRASCPDCHVPKEWQHKIVRKIRASNELWHHLLGSISTTEKYEKKRLQLAKNEWRRMKTTDSRECRNCHKFDYMDYSSQEPRAARVHDEALKAGKTCIDCHRGIAHKLPPNATEAYEELISGIEKETKSSLAGYLQHLSAPANAATATERASNR